VFGFISISTRSCMSLRNLIPVTMGWESHLIAGVDLINDDDCFFLK